MNNEPLIPSENNHDSENEKLLRFKSILGSEALLKATEDEFDYALKLRSGEVICFSSARLIDENWVTLTVHKYIHSKNPLPFPAERGVDVRISDIVWVMDAPCGS